MIVRKKGDKCYMKKENSYKLLYVIAIILMIAFVVTLSVDYLNYNTYSNSAPFYAFIVERVVEFIIPSIIAFGIGKFIKKKYHKKELKEKSN